MSVVVNESIILFRMETTEWPVCHILSYKRMVKIKGKYLPL
jgi:hypothetical protein